MVCECNRWSILDEKTFTFRTIAENTLILEPTDDATILENYPNDNSGTGESITLRSLSGGEWDGLIKFNLSALPSNATIRYTSLSAYYYKNWDGKSQRTSSEFI